MSLLGWGILSLFSISQSAAQNIQPVREKVIQFGADTIQLDTLSLQFGKISFQTDKESILPDKFYMDYASARIFLLDNSLKGENIKISYMVFPFNFSKTYLHKERKTKGYVLGNEAPYIYKPNAEQNDVFGYSTLNRSGTFTRGISFGNNQDLVLNSFVDIQLSGKIAPDIEVLASLNDRNIPIQPEGTTAQIQNFDQKFISVTLPHQKVMLGDLQLVNQPSNYFLKYNKKVQGITAQSTWNVGGNDSGFTAITASLTKGKWQRQSFNGIEGNQGPYRLQGKDGELYVIVVAGTEKVYINGELMKRGEQNDYKIDYNTGELTFTTNRMITKYDRIIAEFQYADRNYQRYLLHGFSEYKIEKWDFAVNVYHEQDNAQQPILNTLRPQDKEVLSKIGDSVQNAFSQSGDSIAFTSDRVLYKRKDSLGYKKIFVFSNNSDSAHWQVSFSFVGTGRGNYKQIKALANGKVYGWIAPKDGVPQGDYEPVLKIVAPQKQQMITFSGKHQFGSQGKIGAEGSLSSRDVNTFSNLDDGDNAGTAARVYADNIFQIKKEAPMQLQYHAEYEHRDKNYTEVERTRSVEFTRIWNRQLSNATDFTDKAEENIGTLSIGLLNKSNFTLSNLSSFYRRGDYFNGYLEKPVLDYRFGKYYFNSYAELTFINDLHRVDSLHNKRTEKYFADFSRSFGKLFRLGIGATQEQSIYTNRGKQLIANDNFKYDEGKIYLSNTEKSVAVYGIEVNQRRDYTAWKDEFLNSNTGQNLLAKLYLLSNSDRQLKLDFKYRNNISDTAIGINVPKKKESTYLTHVEYLLNLFHDAINTSSIYEISTGRELRRDFVYVQVAKGQGTHVWNDYNHNGLKEFNEFENAPFKDLGEYIRVIVPSTQYENTLTSMYQQNVRLLSGKFFSGSTTLSKFFGRFTDNANVSILNKLHTDPSLVLLNPFYTKINDTQLVTSNSLIRNVFYFNRTSPVWGTDYSFMHNTSKSFLVSGFESRNNIEHTINLRWNISADFTLEPIYTSAQRNYKSDYFSAKDFSIAFKKQGGILAWQLTQKLRMNLNYFYTNQDNKLSIEKEFQHDGGMELRYNWLGKAIVSARFDYISIQYAYDPATPIAYEMLTGLLPGNNYTWNATWNQRLQNSLQLSFSYDGRKSEGTKTVHVGRANVTWFF